jgi:hypothetical protein
MLTKSSQSQRHTVLVSQPPRYLRKAEAADAKTLSSMALGRGECKDTFTDSPDSFYQFTALVYQPQLSGTRAPPATATV